MPMPVQSAQADQLVKLLAGAPGGAPAQGGPGGGVPAGAGALPAASPTAQALQSASQQLDGANPQGMIQVLQQMNSDLAQVYLTAAMRAPDATKDIDTARQALQRALKVFQKLASTQSAIAPIVNNAGLGNPQTAMGGTPDISALLGMNQ